MAQIRFNIQTITHIKKLYEKFAAEKIFGRGDVAKTCGISYSTAGNLVSKMRRAGLIDEVQVHGKGKYRFG